MKSGQRLTHSVSDDGRYRLLVDAITDYAIYMLDPDGIVANWNSGAQRFKGYRADEIIGQHFSRFYPEEDRLAGLPEQALAIARAEGKFEREGWRLRKNGERFWAHVVIDPVWLPNGELVGFAKITRDLTERLAAAETLRQSEEQFRLLVQSVTDYAIYRLDRDGNVVSWNSGAERIKGYAPQDIIGSHFSRFYTDEDRAAGEPARALATATNEGRFAAEGWRIRKDGTRFRAGVVIDPIRNERGELIGFAKITRDLTDRDEAQRELEAAREALFQSQKLEAIGQLTGGVAHDFNNLLMAIQSSLALIEKRLPDDPQLGRLLDNARQGVERGAALTQRMLAFARRQDLTVAAIDIPALVRGMRDLLARTLGPAYEIELRFEPDLPPVLADSNQLEMALLNLAVNARDAMPDGGLIVIAADRQEVRSGARGDLAPGNYVTLAMIDTGIGMDPETLTHATEPFFTTKGVGKGTGLGLSMIHGLAEQMKGMLVLQSVPGLGTTAKLWLPAATGDAPPQVLKTSDNPTEVSADRLRILAVDDDDLVLMNTVALLEDLGHEVLSASNGAEALGILTAQGEVALLITDQAMPGMTGIQLAERARQIIPHLPIILATGYGELPEGAPSGIRKLGKPFTQRDLAKAVARASAREIHLIG